MFSKLRKFFILIGEFISSHHPDVIVDFIFEKGLFFIAIKNIGKKSAYRVSIHFDNKIIGVEGTKEISALSLFKNIEFLPPKKDIITFLDTSSSYFRGENPTMIVTNIKYHDCFGFTYNRAIKHDLEIYREIGFIDKQCSTFKSNQFV